MIEGWFLSRSTIGPRARERPGPSAGRGTDLVVVRRGSRCSPRRRDRGHIVAQVVPSLVVGVVRQPHGVEVVALHDLDVADHVRELEGLAHPLSCSWRLTPLMSDPLAVDEEGAVAHFDAPEAEGEGGMLDSRPSGESEADDEGVERRVLVAPFRGFGGGKLEASLPSGGR